MKFFSIDDAIRVLRKGKKDEQWFEAASFLIERASPEVKLMMDVGREIEKKDQQEAGRSKNSRPIKKWVLVFFGVTILGVAASYIGWLAFSGLKLSC